MVQWLYKKIQKGLYMKKILTTILLFIFALSLSSCSVFNNFLSKDTDDNDKDNSNDGSKPGSDFKMTAIITEVSDVIAVEVTESEYTFGVHWVLISDATEFFGKNGETISRSDLKAGDTVEILYSGQVMMSYPPQIVAARISVK